MSNYYSKTSHTSHIDKWVQNRSQLLTQVTDGSQLNQLLKVTNRQGKFFIAIKQQNHRCHKLCHNWCHNWFYRECQIYATSCIGDTSQKHKLCFMIT